MKLVPVFRNGEDPNFNYSAALEAYNWAVENPEEAVIVAKSLAFDEIVELVDRNKVELQEAIDNEIQKRASETRNAIKRAAVSKAANGEEIDRLVALGEEISKADSYTADERRRNAMRQWRGPGGQFRTMGVKIQPVGSQGALRKPLTSSAAASMGVPNTEGLSFEQKTRVQNAYLQVADALSSVQGLNKDDVSVAYNYVDIDGNLTETKIKPKGQKPEVDVKQFRAGNTLDSIEVTVNPNLSAYGASYNIIDRMAGPNVAGNAVSIGGAFGEAFPKYARTMNAPMSFEAQAVGSRQEDFRRLAAASSLVQATLGNQIGPAGLVATQLGNWVGTHGPEAEKVLGPGTRKAAYRFRGVEKRPDPKLQSAIDSEMRKIVRSLTKSGMSPQKAQAHARDYLIYGPESALGKYTADGRTKGKLEVNESPLVLELLKDLPSMELAQLQLSSGHVPPSHGIIIDRKGTVVSQAVGYGDDWYLPFNLRTLNMVNGGEYLRTRMLGGPTSEDLYASLVSEARGFTVMSRSGVFNVEFDPTFRGSRRFNDKAKRMVDRYEKLLDAVKSRNVSPLIPESRDKELRDAAIEANPNNREGEKADLAESREREKRYPTMSQEDMQKAKESWINSSYAPTRQTKDGSTMDYQDLKSQYINDYVVSEAKKPAQESFDWNAAAADLATGDVGADTYNELNNQLAAMPSAAKYQLASMGDASALSEKKSKAALMNEASAKFDADPISALAEKDPSITAKWESAQKQIQHAYSIEHQSMQLDSQGYYNALKALQEQFPYYIKRVQYRPLPGQNVYGGNIDTGYVKPRFNRPAAAQASYYDQSILGRGKVSADRVQYQNANVVRPGTSEEKVSFESSGGYATSKLTPQIAEIKRKREINDSRWTLYKHLTNQNTHFVWGETREGMKAVPLNFNDGGITEANLANSGVAVPSLTGNLAEIAQVIPGVPANRSELRINNGQNRTGPFTEREFEFLMNEYPGFPELFMRDAETAQLNFRTRANQNLSSVQANLMMAGQKAPEGDNLSTWGKSGKIPLDAIKYPSQEFNFQEPKYKTGLSADSYKRTATDVTVSAKNFAAKTDSTIEAFNYPFEESSFPEFLSRDIDKVTKAIENADGENEHNYARLLENLHRLRRLHTLYSAKNLFRAVGDIEAERGIGQINSMLAEEAQKKANESGV